MPDRCPSVYPSSANGPYSDETGYGWSGPLRCVLSSHCHDLHLNSGISWRSPSSAPCRFASCADCARERKAAVNQ